MGPLCRLSQGKRLLTEVELAAIQGAMFGAGTVSRPIPDDAHWTCVYMSGDIPSMDDWPPSRFDIPRAV